MSEKNEFEKYWKTCSLRHDDHPMIVQIAKANHKAAFETGRELGLVEAAEIIKAADEAFTTYEESFSYAEEQIRQRMEGK